MILNDDVLRQICDLLSHETLRIASVTHPVFLERYIREKYQIVDFTRSDCPSKRLWRHVLESPCVSNAVQSVHISPWLVKAQTQSYQSQTDHAFNKVAMLFDPEYTTKKVRKRFNKALDQDLGHTRALFSVLTKVQRYSIDWDESPSYPSELFTAFLQPLYAWGNTLTGLSIHIPVDMLNSFVSAKLPHLRDIHICLSSRRMSREKIDLHLDGFMVFLHNLKDTLTSLSVKTSPYSENLELSRFYRHLGTFPHLRAISLMIPFDGAQLVDPQPFCAFLHRHAGSLQSLALRTTRCAAHAERTAAECFNWIQTIISSIQEPFPELRHIALALRPLKASFVALENFLALQVTTLQSVALTDRTLAYGDVCNHILPPLTTSIRGGPLVSLEMRVDCMEPQLLPILARKLPQLKTLRLSFSDSDRMNRMMTSNHNMIMFTEYIGSVFSYHTTWELERLEVSPGPQGLWIDTLRSALLAPRIPSLHTIVPLEVENIV